MNIMKRIVSSHGATNSPHSCSLVRGRVYSKQHRTVFDYSCCIAILIFTALFGTIYMNQTWKGITRATIYNQMKNNSASEFTNNMQAAKSTATTTTAGGSSTGSSTTQYKSRFTNSSKTTNSKNSIIFPAVDALTVNNNANGYPHRVLAYGDSLTAGTCGPNYFPYSVYLEQALYERQQQKQREGQNNGGTDGDVRNIVVRHRGIPGLKVQEMVDNLDGDRRGLRNAIQSISDPSLSIAILLAGTNDLGYELIYHNNNVELAAETILKNIMTLHQVCYDNQVPYTIAVGVPSSGYQYRMVDAANVVSIVNEQLQRYASAAAAHTNVDGTVTPPTTAPPVPLDDKGRSRMIYMEFPFEYIPNGENWHSDTLHLSKKGYEVLGESFVPVVEQIVYQYLSDE